MKVITLHQPWASAIALGLKQFETRHWQTPYRGKLAIHAGKKPIDIYGIDAWHKAWQITKQDLCAPDKLPLGVIVAAVRIP